MTPGDRRRFLTSLSDAFNTPDRISAVLQDIGFPPRWQSASGDGSAESTWREALLAIDAGLIADGHRTLLEMALAVYSHNQTWLDLAGRYAPELINGSGQAQAGTQANQPGQVRPLSVMIQADDEETRRSARDYLAAHGLGPTEIWSTNHVTLFALQQQDASLVRQELAANPDLVWTVIPPEGQTYLLSHLTVQGPDGRFFRFTDVPAQQTVAEVAADTLARYPAEAGTNRTAVTDHVQASGQGVRLNPDTTLHDAGVHDGDQLRVAYGTHAGSVNPLYHADALVRAGNQIRAFVDVHPEVTLWMNAPDLATTYELQFKKSSWGPPPEPGLDPVRIEDHVVQMEFGANFPQDAPTVFWLTPIFHPNIWPNYDSPKFRERPQARGLVCLGDLTDAYQPALDLGQLCQSVLDVAAFRNYGLFQASGQVALDADGQPRDLARANFFDEAAAFWVLTHQDLIEGMAERSKSLADGPPGAYRGVIEDYFP